MGGEARRGEGRAGGREGTGREGEGRSEERRVGKEGGVECRSRWGPDH